MKAEIYSRTTCPHCVKAKALLTQKGIPYTEYIIGAGHSKEDVEARLVKMGITSKVNTVPQIFYTDKQGKVHYIGGNDALHAKQAILGT